MTAHVTVFSWPGARRGMAACVLLWLLAACAQQPAAPVVDRSRGWDAATSTTAERSAVAPAGIHTVREGDTLYGIAWHHNLDYKALAAANGIDAPFTVFPGQRIRLQESPPGRAGTRARARRRHGNVAPRRASNTEQVRPRVQPAPPKQEPSPPSPPSAADAGWRAPVSGKPVRAFGGASKGIDYQLPPNTPVLAAAAGEVVYAGPGLGGYRHLVIVKASERHLVAYGVNVQPTPNEGERIAAGATIATIGAGDAAAGRFHFEIRDNGKPVNPRSLIHGL